MEKIEFFFLDPLKLSFTVQWKNCPPEMCGFHGFSNSKGGERTARTWKCILTSNFIYVCAYLVFFCFVFLFVLPHCKTYGTSPPGIKFVPPAVEEWSPLDHQGSPVFNFLFGDKFRLTEKLQKNSTESSQIPFTLLPWLLTSYITIVHLSKLRN